MNKFLFYSIALVICSVVLFGPSVTVTVSDANVEELTAEKQTTQTLVDIWNSTRLPTDVKPLHYSILLYPNLQTGIFSGQTNITLEFKAAKNFIVLNSAGLNISNAVIKNTVNQHTVSIVNEFMDKINEFYVILLQENIDKGIYELYLEFQGVLRNKLQGLYMSSYKDELTQKRRHMATSKFEPTYARQAFPCFDEPSFKSNFSIQLVKPSGENYIALSNMNQVEEFPDLPQAGLTTVRFAESVPMSTYLVCFIVCDFDHLEPVMTKHGFPITVYARPGEVRKMQYALDLAVKAINFYTNYFGIKYPLPKLDLIAIPDFVSGAMEHWGLVTFRETHVLFSEDSSSSNKKQVSLTVSHELAHMWFGNLVTMEWWNDLWLNEGFASYMEYKAVNNSHHDWDMDTQILVDDVQRTLSLDAAQNSHPIVQTVSHPDQITEIFDTISYSKGATIIRMLEDMIEPEAFQRGVSEYLKRFAYDNAETIDLWNTLERQSKGIKISKVMAPWTEQKGFPIVSIKRSGDNLILSQRKFTLNINNTFDVNESEFHYKWDIPLTYVTSKNSSEVHRAWFYMDQSSATITLPPGTEWFKFNHKQIGYYRVLYSAADWQKLTKLLQDKPEMLTAADRANIIDDAFSLAKAGFSNYKSALDTLLYLPKEKHFVPWVVALHKLQSLQGMLSSTPHYIQFKKYVHKLFSPVMTDSLWNVTNSSYIERKQKLATLELGCSLRIPSCIAKVQSIFNNWLLSNGTKPEPEFKSIVYNYGMSNAGETEWEKLWQIYLAEEDPQEKAKLRSALTNVREPWILHRLIDLAKDENNVRSQDFLSLIYNIAENPIGIPIVWDFVRDQWNYLVKRFTLNNRSLGTLIPRITSTFSTKTKLNELKEFLAANPEAGAGAAGRKIAVERVENNIRWLKANLGELSLILIIN